MNIAERPGFQKWFWGVQRISWVLLAAAVLAALAGMTGAGGPGSVGRSERPSSSVDYPAILRANRAEIFQVRGLAPIMVLDAVFLDTFKIESIMPAPLRQTSIGGGLRLIFDGTGQIDVSLSVTPKLVLRRTVGLTMGADIHSLPVLVLP